MKNLATRTLAVAGAVLALTFVGCSRYSLDDVPQPDPDLAAPAPDGAVLERDELDHHAMNMVELIQGRLPGVEVSTDPRAGVMVRIRGRTNPSDDSGALIVVDGVESTGRALLAMNPQEVQRIEVLKDGSAAIYGVRGANGVLLITTRRWRS